MKLKGNTIDMSCYRFLIGVIAIDWKLKCEEFLMRICKTTMA
ncbi:unnamed protein product [Chironomus riparius]|uniref:Uncharacterized protein n=1 Tax=Chironomus riparius TaxID=315576 RepID=A0A9N9RNS2_9DIPT|nr:unnamed protein product [Chironomus riparius]